ncbi:hypothetical protein NDI47_17385 [Microcoleus vaginatus GB1-A2]|uniref:hypothetical protein n=1 Tax=Microcoleus vaginatus TaxID=119532 RepID=UPI0016840E7D|nr:hypothetical protein [Microcoleus sp. FACHB-61]
MRSPIKHWRWLWAIAFDRVDEQDFWKWYKFCYITLQRHWHTHILTSRMISCYIPNGFLPKVDYY